MAPEFRYFWYEENWSTNDKQNSSIRKKIEKWCENCDSEFKNLGLKSGFSAAILILKNPEVNGNQNSKFPILSEIESFNIHPWHF